MGFSTDRFVTDSAASGFAAAGYVFAAAANSVFVFTTTGVWFLLLPDLFLLLLLILFLDLLLLLLVLMLNYFQVFQILVLKELLVILDEFEFELGLKFEGTAVNVLKLLNILSKLFLIKDASLNYFQL